MNRCPICSKMIQSHEGRFIDEDDIVYHWSCWTNARNKPVPINPIEVIETRQRTLYEFEKGAQ